MENISLLQKISLGLFCLGKIQGIFTAVLIFAWHGNIIYISLGLYIILIMASVITAIVARQNVETIEV